MKSLLMNWLRAFGVLRIILLCFALFSLILRPTPVIDPVYQGWNIVIYLLLPVFAPIQFMLHTLDALMGLVLRSGKAGIERTRYNYIVITQFLVAVAILARWVPYFLAINAKP